MRRCLFLPTLRKPWFAYPLRQGGAFFFHESPETGMLMLSRESACQALGTPPLPGGYDGGAKSPVPPWPAGSAQYGSAPEASPGRAPQHVASTSAALEPKPQSDLIRQHPSRASPRGPFLAGGAMNAALSLKLVPKTVKEAGKRTPLLLQHRGEGAVESGRVHTEDR